MSKKIRSQSFKKLYQKNLPSIKSSMLMSKAMLAISKVDIDSRTISKQKNNFLITTVDKKHERSHSGFSLNKPKESIPQKIQPKTSNIIDFQQTSSFKLYIKDIKEQFMQNDIPKNNHLIIQKSKISTKSYGIIKCYSANSHAGLLNNVNEDRICIVTNLTKTMHKNKQVSFFGIYDGNDGVARADYMRDYFHLILIECELFWRDIEGAFQRTLKKINYNFKNQLRFLADESTVSFVIVIVINEEIHYFQSGGCKSVFSKNFGQQIYFPSSSQCDLLIKQSSRKAKSVSQLLKKVSLNKIISTKEEENDKIQCIYRIYGLQESIDFIVLGSEGVFENLKLKEIGKKVWYYILRNKQDQIHLNIGDVNNSILNDVFNNISTKNASIIIIGFKNIASCLENQKAQELNLPYLDKIEILPNITIE